MLFVIGKGKENGEGKDELNTHRNATMIFHKLFQDSNWNHFYKFYKLNLRKYYTVFTLLLVSNWMEGLEDKVCFFLIDNLKEIELITWHIKWTYDKLCCRVHVSNVPCLKQSCRNLKPMQQFYLCLLIYWLIFVIN